jgi:predicted transport protein
MQNIIIENELLQEDNILKAVAYIGSWIKGDYRYTIELHKKKEIVFFELMEN